MSQNAVLFLFAIINVIVVALFAGTILRQYLRRRREAQLYWTLALLMAFGATLAYILMVASTPTSQMGIFYFRLYYTLGAALTPAWLGLGSLALVLGKRVVRTCCFLLCGASLLAVVTISEARIDPTALSKIAGTPGTGGPYVVDTIGLSAHMLSFIDMYRTPHTEKLHVIERFKVTADNKFLEALVKIEDEDTFNEPMYMTKRWRRDANVWQETICAENNIDPFNENPIGVPQAERPDF